MLVSLDIPVCLTLIAKSALMVLVSGMTVSAVAGPAHDEQLLGLWQSENGCVVHIFEDGSDSLAGAAWGQRKESAELVIEFSGDRRFAWKRKTKKSGFGDDGEVDPKRSGRFIVDLHDRQVLHSDNWPCFHPRNGPAARFSRQSTATVSNLSVPDWYSDTFSQVIEGASVVGSAEAESQVEKPRVSETPEPNSITQSDQGTVQNSQAGQTSEGGGLGGLLNALNTFNDQMQKQVEGQFPAAASNQGQPSTQLGGGTGSGGLTGLFGAAGKKKNTTTSPSSDQVQSSTAGLGGLLSGLTSAGQPSSSSGDGPRNLEEFRQLVTMGPVDAHFLGKEYAGYMLGDDPALPVTDRRVQYVQAVLDTLVRYSRIPFVYRTYAVILLDDYETVNAFTAPGGFIAVHTGMLDIFENEDELALILAHELAHSELNHGISAVVTEESAKFFQGFAGDIVGNDLVGGFVNSLYDIGVKGYNVEIEAEADERALLIAQRAGYDPGVFPGIMEKFKSVTGHYGGEGYPPDRAERIQRHLMKVSYLGSAEAFAARSARFHAVFGH